MLRSQIQSGRAGIDSHNANKNVGERWIEQRVPSQIICGTFCRVPKEDGGLRPVYNIIPLNHYVQYHHFKMEILSMVKATLLKNDYMVKIDRKDAYQCIPVHTQDRAFMRFQWVASCIRCGPPFRTGLGSETVHQDHETHSVAPEKSRSQTSHLFERYNYLQPMPKPTASRHEFPRFLLRNLGLVANVRQLGMSPMTLIVYLAMTERICTYPHLTTR